MNIKANKRKYLKLCNQKSVILTLDWLTLNIQDHFSQLEFDELGLYKVGSFVLENKQTRTKHFENLADVFLSGEKVGTLTYTSSHKQILKDRAHFKLENHLFYNNSAKGVVQEFIQQFQLTDVRVSRVDIAADGVYFHQFIKQVLFTNGKVSDRIVRVNDRDNIKPWFIDRDSIKNCDFTQFYVGEFGNKSTSSKRSDKFARYYCKSSEIEANKKKEYILDYFKANNFEGEVYRYEVQLSSNYLRNLDGFTVFDLFDLEKLQNLFITANKGFFEFAYNTNKNIARCQRVELFKGFSESLYVKIKRVVMDSLRTIRVGIKRTVKECYLGILSKPWYFKEREHAIENVINLINVYDLHDWFNRVCGSWWDEIKKTSIAYNIKCPATQLKMII